MRPYVVIRYMGIACLFTSLFLFVSFTISLVLQESSMFSLLYSFIITFLTGLFPLSFIPPISSISKREAFYIVVLSWLLICFIGVIPYVLWGGEFTFINALFESVSGFTTTGSTILNNVEALPYGLLFWRSSTHWIGGIGIIILVLVVLPNMGHAKALLFKTEFSALANVNLLYNTKHVVRILLLVYIGLTVLETILLWIFGMSIFDAINHAFATIATGGFSTKNLSIAHYNSPAIEIIIMVFMVLSGIHFGLLFATIVGKKFALWHSQITRYYLVSMLMGIGIVSIDLWAHSPNSFLQALRMGSFQVISLGTTTGFASADSAHWPYLSVLVLLFFTLQCGCAGSTSGGLKADRVYIFLRTIKERIKGFHHPQAVFCLKVDKRVINDTLLFQVLQFIAVYLVIIFISTLLLAGMNVDILTGFSASAAAMGNVGPGFGIVSSLGNFSSLPALGKGILSIVMLLGRLEIFALLSLLFYRSWR